MAPLAYLIHALETALRGVPFLAATPAEPSWGFAIVAAVASAAAIILAGLVLLLARRRRSASHRVDQQRSTEATDRAVSAVLMRRTLSRGRLALDDEVLAGPVRAPAADTTDDATRRSS